MHIEKEVEKLRNDPPHSLKDSLKKELTKSEGKRYTKNFIQKTSKAVKWVLNNSLQPKNFKINAIPSEDSKLCFEIEPTETKGTGL